MFFWVFRDKKIKSGRTRTGVPTANYFGGSCVFGEGALHARDHAWASRCYFSLLVGAGALRWPCLIFSFWSFYSHTRRPAERHNGNTFGQQVFVLANVTRPCRGWFGGEWCDLVQSKYAHVGAGPSTWWNDDDAEQYPDEHCNNAAPAPAPAPVQHKAIINTLTMRLRSRYGSKSK
jgi:hypothetical protein